MNETPIYDAVLVATGIDPEPIRHRERWSIARGELEHLPGLGQRALVTSG